MEDKLNIPLLNKKPEENEISISRNLDDQNNLSSDSPNIDKINKDESNSVASPPKESDENMKSSESKDLVESKLENGNHQDVVMADESEAATVSNIIINETRNEH